MEDTSRRDLLYRPDCDPDCERCPENFEPRITFEICDGEDVVQLGFDVDTEAGRANALHKLDTLLAAVSVFRATAYLRSCAARRSASKRPVVISGLHTRHGAAPAFVHRQGW